MIPCRRVPRTSSRRQVSPHCAGTGRRVTRSMAAPEPAAGHRTKSASGTSRAAASVTRSCRSGARWPFSHLLMLFTSRSMRSARRCCVRPAACRASRSCVPMIWQRARTQSGGDLRCTRPRWIDLGQKSLPTWVILGGWGRRRCMHVTTPLACPAPPSWKVSWKAVRPS